MLKNTRSFKKSLTPNINQAFEINCKHAKESEKATDTEKSTNFFSWSFIAKLSGFVTIFSGISGLGYQKGLISAMSFGNMQGSYDVKEILYSSIQAYFSFFTNLVEVSSIEILKNDILFFPIVSVTSSLIFYGMYANRERIRSLLVRCEAKVKKHHYSNAFVNYAVVAVIGFIIGLSLKLIQAVGMFLFIAVIALLLLPSALAFRLGELDAEKAMKNDPCHSLSKNELEELKVSAPNSYLHQCTHFVINKKLLRGKVMLGTQQGYYLRINGAFVYVSKDGSRCIYSQDQKVSEINSVESSFPKIEQLQDFCQFDSMRW